MSSRWALVIGGFALLVGIGVTLEFAPIAPADGGGIVVSSSEASAAAQWVLVKENHAGHWIVDGAEFLPAEATIYDDTGTLRWRPLPRPCLAIPEVPPLQSFGLLLSSHGLSCPPPPIWAVRLHDGDLRALAVVNALHGHSDSWAWVRRSR